jgi:hypothetical protein
MDERRLLRLARRMGHMTSLLYPYLSYARSFLRRRHHILRIWPEGRIELGERVAVFTHFDRRGRLADHVVAYVRALHGCGFSVVFVTNSGTLPPDSLAALQPFCTAVIVRRNVGYDFGAVSEAIALLDLPQPETERLLIANDSVFGPLRPIQDMIERVDFNQADLWGATESWQYRYHLQSYFLVAGRRAMTSPAWQAFWRSVRQVSSKRWVIARYEVGITQMLLRAGLRCRPLWPYHELLDHVVCASKASENVPVTDDPIDRMRAYANERLRAAAAKRAALNPTSDLWRQLLLAGFPFLKVELLRKNPSQVPDVADWRQVLADIPGADLAMIERHLQLQMRNRSP